VQYVHVLMSTMDNNDAIIEPTELRYDCP